jgi:hypothetical protein
MRCGIWALIFLCIAPARGEKVADLPELDRPASMALADSTLYVCDSDAVHMYALEPFRFIRTLGRGGEGPGEFNSSPHLSVHPDGLFINTMGKVMEFTRAGDFQGQTKIPFVYWYFYYPLMRSGDNYVGVPLQRTGEVAKTIHTVNLYDPQLKPITEFYRGGPPAMLPPPPPGGKVVKVDYQVIPDCLEVAVHSGRIYVADSRRGFSIAVFDGAGKHLFDWEIEHTRLRVPEKFKRRFWEEMRAADNWEDLKRRFNYVIRHHFPAFFSMKIQQGKMYLTTYSEKDGLREIVVLDLQGSVLKRVFACPLDPEFRLLRGIAPFSNEYVIRDDTFYYLILNEDTMLYELHARRIGR